LQAELFRAVRLVVDTGIHDKRWTREEAISYMLANTGMAESDVTSEIERYIVIPGQATAYKVGMMKILEVRQKAKDALGDKFVLGEFHDVVKASGDTTYDRSWLHGSSLSISTSPWLMCVSTFVT
jgi:uncharacterized protein (DUF885 family)